MTKTIRSLFSFSLIAIVCASCSKKEFDEYYGRPENLEEPVYQILEERGNFSMLLKTIEKAGYKDVLGTSGYWTMFAPNDDAFGTFLNEQGLSSVDDIDSILAGQIVKYALTYNAYRSERLPDYQSSTGWVENMAFKRRTAYYDGFKRQTIDGQERVVIGSNRNNTNGSNYYVSGDNNNKYITYFADEFLSARGYGSYDYNFFYPNNTLSPLNIMQAQAIDTNIVAENGIIHETDKVLLPPKNLDDYISQTSQYSLFYKLLEDNLVTYVRNEEASNSYYNFTGNTDDVYIKVYDQALPFSPTNENFLKEMDNDGQANGYTIFAPENTVFQEFINEVLLKNYPSLDQLPKYIYEDLYNAHMWPNSVWPSRFQATVNGLEEEPRFDFDSEIIDAQQLSNGFFYGTNKVQPSNYFYSVYTSPYLDPAYTLMTRLLNDPDGYRNLISNINRRWTLFMMSDEVLRNLGYDYDIDRSEWVYESPENGNIVTGNIAKQRALRILYNHIVLTPNDELDNLSGSGIIRTGDSELPGEYIKYENNTVYAAGNEVLGNVVNITGSETQNNGIVYFTDNLLEFSEEAPGLDLKRLAEEPNSGYDYFFKYLENSQFYNPDGSTISIVTLGSRYTFIIPDNDAIQQAVDDGVLPATDTGEPNFSPSEFEDQEQVSNFIRFHIIADRIISDDGKVTGEYTTLLKDELGNSTFLAFETSPGNLTVTDENGRVANFIPSASNNLADRSLIHLIDNYLSFTE